MKSIIAAITVAIALASALPASAGYTSPDATRLQQAFQHGVP